MCTFQKKKKMVTTAAEGANYHSWGILMAHNTHQRPRMVTLNKFTFVFIFMFFRGMKDVPYLLCKYCMQTKAESEIKGQLHH